jgi:hypothetical protein
MCKNIGTIFSRTYVGVDSELSRNSSLENQMINTKKNRLIEGLYFYSYINTEIIWGLYFYSYINTKTILYFFLTKDYFILRWCSYVQLNDISYMGSIFILFQIVFIYY